MFTLQGSAHHSSSVFGELHWTDLSQVIYLGSIFKISTLSLQNVFI